VSLEFLERGVWSERRSLTDEAGYTTTQTFTYVPASNGCMSVTILPEASSDRGVGAAVDAHLREEAPNVLVLTATLRSTGRPMFVETTTLHSATSRVRSQQVFDSATGAFTHSVVCLEHRVIDEVTGKMTRKGVWRPSNDAP
jgi:hypothetical protein